MAAVKGVLTPGLLSPGLLEAYMARYELSKDQVLEQKEAFDLLDIDGNGKVTYQEVKEMNAKLGQPMSEQELSEQFTTLDVDGLPPSLCAESWLRGFSEAATPSPSQSFSRSM
ncbi:unnamed protein product [Symbiodinium sp. CCMP2456]|nr:unnamed protein product [Symbiodinium sp. CCMP2456]